MTVASLRTEQNKKEERTFSVGILISLASWSLMFTTIFWGYLVYRWRTNIWLEEFISSRLTCLAVINTMVLIASGIFLRLLFRENFSSSRLKWLNIGFWSTGLWFLAGQVLLWRGLIQNGLTFRESVAANFFFLLTGFHAVHIVGVLIAVGIISMRRSDRRANNAVKGVQYFWDFLTVIWGIMFVVIFVIQ